MRVEFDKRTSAELNQAIPPTETLNVEAAKEKAGLARQGSLVDRQPPSSLVQKRQILANNGSDIPMMEDDVSKGFLSMKILYCLTFYFMSFQRCLRFRNVYKYFAHPGSSCIFFERLLDFSQLYVFQDKGTGTIQFSQPFL